MKKYILIVLSAVFIYSCDTISKLPGYGFGGSISETDARMGIQEALGQGVTTAIFNLNKQDGFFEIEIDYNDKFVRLNKVKNE